MHGELCVCVLVSAGCLKQRARQRDLYWFTVEEAKPLLEAPTDAKLVELDYIVGWLLLTHQVMGNLHWVTSLPHSTVHTGQCAYRDERRRCRAKTCSHTLQSVLDYLKRWAFCLYLYLREGPYREIQKQMERVQSYLWGWLHVTLPCNPWLVVDRVVDFCFKWRIVTSIVLKEVGL